MKQMKTILITIIVSLLLSISASAQISSPPKCETCHDDIAANFSTSLHHNAQGMFTEYEDYAMDHFGLDTDAYYEQKNCQKCHVQSCTECHVDSYEAHNQRVDPEVCEKCHAKKQSSTYIGDLPLHKAVGGNADIHHEKNLTCTNCHSANEMHGDGEYYKTMMAAVKVDCKDCHTPHEQPHDTLDCNSCHTGWLLSCDNCHIESRKGMTVSTDSFYLAKDKDGMVSVFMKMETKATIANNTSHIIYAEWHPHTTTSTGKACDFCHDDPSLYVMEDEIFGGEGGSGFTLEEVKAIMSAEMPTEPEPEIGMVETIRNWVQSLIG